MSKELADTLKKLENLVGNAGGHLLAVVTYPASEEEAEKVYVAGDWTRCSGPRKATWASRWA